MEVSADPAVVASAIRHGIEALAENGDLASRMGLATSRSVPQEVLAVLASDDATAVQEAVAAHPATPHEQLGALAASRGWPLKAAVAGNPGTPAALLQELAESPSVLVRTAVARNPAAPDHVRALLALDSAQAVRDALREPPRAGATPGIEGSAPPPPDASDIAALVRAWVDDGWVPDGGVLLLLLSGPQERLVLPAVLLRDPRLAARAVADAAVAELAREGRGWQGTSVFQRILTPAQVRFGLRGSPGQHPAMRAAFGLLAGSDQLALALGNADPAVRTGAAANRLLTDKDQLIALIDDPDPDVAAVAAGRFELAMGRLGG